MNYIAAQEDVKFFLSRKIKKFRSRGVYMNIISYQMLVKFYIGGINTIMNHLLFIALTGGQYEERLYGKGSLGRPES